jgi:hypothetical protein
MSMHEWGPTAFCLIRAYTTLVLVKLSFWPATMAPWPPGLPLCPHQLTHPALGDGGELEVVATDDELEPACSRSC